MFKRYLVTCKRPHLITLICLLTFIGSSQNVYSQQQIALDTHAIFQQSCFNCHGPQGSFKETLLIEHNTLIKENGTVVPGNPETSRLYQRLLGEGGQLMPLGGPPLPDLQIETVKNWILAGAPDWAAPPTTDGDFISPSEVLNTIENHVMSLTPFDRAFARYFTLTHLYNAGEPAGILQEYRKGLSKLVNSLSWGSTVTNPQPIDPEETIFYIDLRHYEWDRNNGWGQIESAYPYHIGYDGPTQTALKAQLGWLQGEMKADIPSVHVDWFLATASLPPLYHDLLSLPLTDRELETRLEVDVPQNLLNAPGVRVWRAGTNNSGVSNHNRVIERHSSQHGAYWKSYDFAGSVGTQNIFNHPLSFTHDGGEVIFNLPNGLQGYYVTNASGFRLDDAPISIVSNPAASDPTVRNGLSCFGCHTEGMKTFEDEVRSVIEANTNPKYDKAQALRLYVEQSAMDALVGEDMDRYRGALKATGGAFDDIEPISRFHEVFQGPVNAAYAAAVVGLETEVFLEKIRENVGLQNTGLLVLDSANGSMKRDAWRSNFPAIIYALDFPDEQVDSPSQPDQPPGSVVHIPDTNLRAVIAETLGKSPNAPITVEEMERLGRLEAQNRGIQDLTGLQFAINIGTLTVGQWGHTSNQISDLSPIAGLINLHYLFLVENQVSDLSPLAGLVNLRHLYISDNPISDISPVRGLTNLTVLHAAGTLVSDISPVRNLANLTRLEIHGTLVTDLSPAAGLTNLKVFNFANENLSDLSPLAGLINLESIFCWGHAISDLSPLAGLIKLEKIDFCGGDISDLTPLAGLTGLKELYLVGEEVSDISPLAGLTRLTHLALYSNDISDISALAGLTNLQWLRINDNDISDVSPLARLTNLTWLGVAVNNISDFSPLDRIRENLTTLHWFSNPGFPKGGPKIEGPWLWAVLPDTTGEQVNDTDWLSEASGGEVTEVKISTHGATEGKSVGDAVWTSHRLPPTGRNNVEDMLKRALRGGTIYGSVSLHSLREQETTMYVGGNRGLRVWLNGILMYERFSDLNFGDYTAFFPVTLKQGRNVLLVAVHTRGNGFFGFEPGTEYTVGNPGVGYTFSKSAIHINDTFTLDIRAKEVFDLAGWQFDITFDPVVLEAIDVSEGDFLKMGSTTFFHGGSIDNAAGKIGGLSAAQLSDSGVSGTGGTASGEVQGKIGRRNRVGAAELSVRLRHRR